MMRTSLLFSFLLLALAGFGQKKVIDPGVYNDWNRIGDIQLSPDGKYSAYTIRPFRGDGYLFIVNNETGKKDSIARGLEPQFSGLSNYLVFKINPGFDTLRNVELKKVSKEKWPKDTLGIWMLANDSLIKIAKVKEFKLSADSDWLAYLSAGNDYPKGYLSKKEQKKEAKALKKSGPVKTDGKLLAIWNPGQKKTQYYRNVTQFDIAKNGAYVSFIEQQKFKKDSVRLAVHTTENQHVWKANRRYTEFSQVNFGTSKQRLVGLFSTDTTEEKRWSGFIFDCASDNWLVFADTSRYFEEKRTISSNYRLKLAPDDSYLQFGVWNAPEKPFKDTLLESEKVKLDLWHWKDERIQPQQIVELKRDQSNYNIHVYRLSDGQFTQIGRDSLTLHFPSRGVNRYVLATCNDAYISQNWRLPMPLNYYRIDMQTGHVLPLRDEVVFDAPLSPSGRYYVYYNEITRQLYSTDVNEGTEVCLTNHTTNWWEDINGMPTMAGPLGILAWTQGEKGVLVQSEHDIWYFDYDSHRLSSITQSLRERDNDTNYVYTLGNFATDSTLYYPENLYLTQFDKASKAMKTYRVSGTFPNLRYTLISGSSHNYVGFKRAKNAETVLFQRHSNSDYPDAFVSLKAGVAEKQISVTNPQQSEYNWSTVELINWTSYDGIPLQGLVYKPENYDANKEYPLLVYYYELYSDEIHNHYAPKPTASIIYPTEYASAGYVVFIPDIRYKPGHPANSAYDCIMSGTDAVLKKYPNIDPLRLGLQGQSWGGYQTAQLITMTDRYKAAMAGAPVGNMFSAYGGIRWGSGYSRQFQYEHSQSRIGKTIWEAPELYMENSPVFHLPKVKTPLLIMHNDADGAVPWYQGVELYTGLRRLGKPVWLLNYNGDDHNLLRNANRMDLSIRMRQFFDYYLLDAPMPSWLKDGIPAVDKGKKFHLETVE